jgi:hypothetical protein
MSAISRALGRYNRLELDESKSKLHDDLQFSVSGWKQLAIVFNDPNVRLTTLTITLSKHYSIPNPNPYSYLSKEHYHHACEEEAPNSGTPIDICDPGEWVKADLGLPVSEAAKEELRKEYKRKMLEDNERTKKARTEKAKQRKVEETTHPVFDYGEILVTEKLKVIDYRKIYSFLTYFLRYSS